MSRDYNFGDPLDRPLPERLEGPAYNNKIPTDYSLRDKRQWLRACRCVGCPIERCLWMREPG